MPHLLFGTDHGGFDVKEELISWLEGSDLGLTFEDLGAFALDPQDDYPVYGQEVARRISETPDEFDVDPLAFGVLLCRTGAGMSIVANRFRGVRAVVCRNLEDARLARAHNNANIMVLEGDYLGAEAAKQMILSFTSTPFDAGRHRVRLQMIEEG